MELPNEKPMMRVLVGVDGSPKTPRVIAAAAHVAHAEHARLLLFHAVGLDVKLPPEALRMNPDDAERLVESKEDAYLRGLAASLPEGLVEGVYVHAGTPWQAICAAAKEHRADLIVIGSHGYGGLDRLLGTTAAKVVNHAHCSVLVVRDA